MNIYDEIENAGLTLTQVDNSYRIIKDDKVVGFAPDYATALFIAREIAWELNNEKENE